MTWVRSIQPLGFVIDTFNQLFPYLLISLTFAFTSMSSCRMPVVRFVPALIGALVAGFLWVERGLLLAHSWPVPPNIPRSIPVGESHPVHDLGSIAWLILLVGAQYRLRYPEPGISD